MFFGGFICHQLMLSASRKKLSQVRWDRYTSSQTWLSLATKASFIDINYFEWFSQHNAALARKLQGHRRIVPLHIWLFLLFFGLCPGWTIASVFPITSSSSCFSDTHWHTVSLWRSLRSSISFSSGRYVPALRLFWSRWTVPTLLVWLWLSVCAPECG